MTATVDRPNLVAFRIVHRAMRGDARRLADTVERIARGTSPCGAARARAVAGYVDTLCDGIHHHHANEDRLLWPVLERSAGAEVDLSALSDDHSHLDPLLDQVRAGARALAAAPADRAVAGRLATLLGTLRDLLDEHIEDEERTIFPIIDRYVSGADWRQVEDQIRKGSQIRFDLPRMERFAAPDELAELYRMAGPGLRIMVALVRPGYRRRERLIFG
ncbi:hemerythrin domain-containing protein [Polymorphospora rubra]|uniref:hemerythrin domain-containing protein n=1 Tax=Polymorphospora rubra TaxID=338584 RepID=UPI0033CCAB27